MLIGAHWLDGVLGPSSVALATIGAGVAAFGGWVLRETPRDPVGTGRVALLADAVWVGATVALAPLVGHIFTVPGDGPQSGWPSWWPSSPQWNSSG